MLDLAARRADIVGVHARLREAAMGADAAADLHEDRVAEKVDWIRESAAAAGRSMAAIELQFTVYHCAITDTSAGGQAARSAFADAWDGTQPVDMGVGGSIPFIAEFLEAFPQASVLVTGVEDPDTRAHGANEGLHLAEFEKVLLAEALLLRNLG